MAKTTWNVRRYSLPIYKERNLRSAINTWVKSRGGRILGRHGRGDTVEMFDWFRRISKTFYHIAPPGTLPLGLESVVSSKQPNLVVCHESSLLYVYASDKFPKMFEDIHERLITPHVLQNGGTPLDKPAQVLIQEKGLKDIFYDVHQSFIRELKEEGKLQVSSLQPPIQTGIRIYLEPEPEKAQSMSEEVSVPPGVNKKVKRSRTIEHTVDVNWRISGSGSIDIGFRPVLSSTIRSEIEREQGRTYQQSETLEYEVALNGEKSTRYKLTWTDVWRKGVAEFPQGNTIQRLPFRFREWAELEVFPIESRSATGRR